MQAISSRWALRVLPWVEASGGTYRVNRRLTYALGDGRLTFTNVGAEVSVVPQELCELPLLKGFDDTDALSALAGRFRQCEYSPGDVLVERGRPEEQVFLIAHGRVNKIGQGKYGKDTTLGVIADGDYMGERVLAGPQGEWDFTAKADTAVTALVMSWREFEELNGQMGGMRAHIQRLLNSEGRQQNEHGEADIDMSAGHEGEADIPGTYVDYELKPRELQLSVAQTVLNVHSRVADLYNNPMDQTQQQMRLTVEALRERQEDEIVNNREFGLLASSDLRNRIRTRSGPPTPDDLDELLSIVWKEPTAFLAHPKAIAAFGREATSRGVYPTTMPFADRQVVSWRGVPVLPCNKLRISDRGTSSIMLLRAGERNQGVIGLSQNNLPDQINPGMNARFMGVNDKGIISYLVSAYYSAAILTPDALGVLEDVEIGRESQ